MRILIVEDDYLQAEWIHKSLRDAIPDAELECVSTESEFRRRFDEIAKSEPDVVVMDVMLRWADPIPEVELPPVEVQKEGFYRAGLRCERLLAEDGRTSSVPVILYTVLERLDLEPELQSARKAVTYLSKQSDISPLHKKIRELTTKVVRDT